MTEAAVPRRAGGDDRCRLLIDVANLYTNQVNLGLSAIAALDGLPLSELAYVHVAGGHSRDGVWHDTHTAHVPADVLDILSELCARVDPPGVLLEWDDDYPSDAALEAELGRIRGAMARVLTTPLARLRPAEAPGRGATSPDVIGSTLVPTPGRCRGRAFGEIGGLREFGMARRVGGEARAALARAQSGLLAALVAGGETASGFDEKRLRIQEFSLISKRRGTVARLRPDLVALLGGDFAGEFEAYARGRPKPPGGSRADARDFAGRLQATGRLPQGRPEGRGAGAVSRVPLVASSGGRDAVPGVRWGVSGAGRSAERESGGAGQSAVAPLRRSLPLRH